MPIFRVNDDLQAALDSVPEGSTVQLGAGTYTAPSGGWRITKSVTIVGTGKRGTIIKPYSAASGQPCIVIDATALTAGQALPAVHLAEMTIQGAATGFEAGNYGVAAITNAVATIDDLSLFNVDVWQMGDDGIALLADNGAAGAIVFANIEGCGATSNYGCGFRIQNSTVVRLSGLYGNSNGLFGIYGYGSEITLNSCAVENNCLQQSDYHGGPLDLFYTRGYGAQMKLKVCGQSVINGLHVESFNDPTNNYAKHGLILEECLAPVVNSILLANGAQHHATADEQNQIGVYIVGGTRGATVNGVMASNVWIPLYVYLADSDAQVYGIIDAQSNSSPSNHLGPVRMIATATRDNGSIWWFLGDLILLTDGTDANKLHVCNSAGWGATVAPIATWKKVALA